VEVFKNRSRREGEIVNILYSTYVLHSKQRETLKRTCKLAD
jgi:hypothetical protein